MEAQISRLKLSAVADAGSLLAEAFRHDPLIGVLLGGKAPRSVRHQLAYAAFFRAAVRELLAGGRVDAATVDGQVAGCAAWAIPEPPVSSTSGEFSMRLDRLLVRALYPLGSRSIEASFEEIAPLHPPEPHWYLAFVGVDPRYQGHGIGALLLRPVLAAADAANQPCYLETPFAETLPFYQRLGFQVTNTLTEAFQGLGPLWTLLRRPGATTSDFGNFRATGG